MSKQAERINEKLHSLRAALGTPRERAAHAELVAAIEHAAWLDQLGKAVRSHERQQARGDAHDQGGRIGVVGALGPANYRESVGGFEGVASPRSKNTVGRTRAQLVERVVDAALAEAIIAERKRRRTPPRRVAMMVLIQRFGGG